MCPTCDHTQFLFYPYPGFIQSFPPSSKFLITHQSSFLQSRTLKERAFSVSSSYFLPQTGSVCSSKIVPWMRDLKNSHQDCEQGSCLLLLKTREAMALGLAPVWPEMQMIASPREVSAAISRQGNRSPKHQVPLKAPLAVPHSRYHSSHASWSVGICLRCD